MQSSNEKKLSCVRTSKLFHNQLLEKSLTFKKYIYCQKRLFPWSIETHQKQCIYQPSECFSCKKTLNLSELKHHIRSNECDVEWMESCRKRILEPHLSGQENMCPTKNRTLKTYRPLLPLLVRSTFLQVLPLCRKGITIGDL